MSTEGELIYPMRLQKFLGRAGVASRRGSEDLISAGRVSVNGVVVCELGTKVRPGVDDVYVDGIRISLSTGHTYLMLNKPAGYLTTMDDPQGRPIVKSLVPASEHPGLFPVGRLDYDTTGLLIFTTDGELAHRLLHPRRHVVKRYIAEVDGHLLESDAELLRRGVMLDDGITKPAEVSIVAYHGNAIDANSHIRQSRRANTNERIAYLKGNLPKLSTTVEIAISEGRKRQIKRMLSFVGHPVLNLTRIVFATLLLDNLESGEWRYLNPQEIEALKALVND